MTLSDAIGKEIFIFDNKEYTEDDFNNLSYEELETLKARINLKITNTVDLIKQYKKIEDKEWLRRKQYVVSVNNKIIPFINAVIRKQKKRNRGLGDYFMDQAKLILPPEDFDSILESAGNEMRLKNGEG